MWKGAQSDERNLSTPVIFHLMTAILSRLRPTLLDTTHTTESPTQTSHKCLCFVLSACLWQIFTCQKHHHLVESSFVHSPTTRMGINTLETHNNLSFLSLIPVCDVIQKWIKLKWMRLFSVKARSHTQSEKINVHVYDLILVLWPLLNCCVGLSLLCSGRLVESSEAQSASWKTQQDRERGNLSPLLSHTYFHSLNDCEKLCEIFIQKNLELAAYVVLEYPNEITFVPRWDVWKRAVSALCSKNASKSAYTTLKTGEWVENRKRKAETLNSLNMCNMLRDESREKMNFPIFHTFSVARLTFLSLFANPSRRGRRRQRIDYTLQWARERGEIDESDGVKSLETFHKQHGRDELGFWLLAGVEISCWNINFFLIYAGKECENLRDPYFSSLFWICFSLSIYIYPILKTQIPPKIGTSRSSNQ